MDLVTDPDDIPNTGDELSNTVSEAITPGLGTPTTNNTIGGTTEAARNVIANSTFNHVRILGEIIPGRLCSGVCNFIADSGFIAKDSANGVLIEAFSLTATGNSVWRDRVETPHLLLK